MKWYGHDDSSSATGVVTVSAADSTMAVHEGDRTDWFLTPLLDCCLPLIPIILTAAALQWLEQWFTERDLPSNTKRNPHASFIILSSFPLQCADKLGCSAVLGVRAGIGTFLTF